MTLLNMKSRAVTSVLLAVLLGVPLWAQTSPRPTNPPPSKNLDELGLQVQDQPRGQSQVFAGEGARATLAK
jgi:hypothetical protein